MFHDVFGSPSSHRFNQRGKFKDVLYSLTLRPGINTLYHTREVYTWLQMFAEIGGIFFLFSTTLIYLMKPLAHFGLTMHLMHYFFFAKDSTMKIFEYDEEER